MENHDTDQRQEKVLDRVESLINKAKAPDPDSITLDKTERKSIKNGLITIISLVVVMAGTHLYTGYTSHTDKTALRQALTSAATENTALTQRIANYEQQIKDLKLKQRQTEDKRYQAQRKLNRKKEQVAKLQGNTKQAKAMVDKLQEMMQLTLDPKTVK